MFKFLAVLVLLGHHSFAKGDILGNLIGGISGSDEDDSGET